jgi:hypothetical protein
MKLIIQLFIFTSISFNGFAQITLNACQALFDDQEFIFTQTGSDATGRAVFETTPITGDQPCSGIGVCEFQIAYNDMDSRWELRADDGNGNFSETYLIYYNTVKSTPYPPDTTLGLWVENSAAETSFCGGDGDSTIVVLKGDVQSEVLSTSSDEFTDLFKLFPNPSSSLITIESAFEVSSIQLFDLTGRSALKASKIERTTLDVQQLQTGFYVVQFENKAQRFFRKIVVQ